MALQILREQVRDYSSFRIKEIIADLKRYRQLIVTKAWATSPANLLNEQMVINRAKAIVVTATLFLGSVTNFYYGKDGNPASGLESIANDSVESLISTIDRIQRKLTSNINVSSS